MSLPLLSQLLTGFSPEVLCACSLYEKSEAKRTQARGLCYHSQGGACPGAPSKLGGPDPAGCNSEAEPLATDHVYWAFRAPRAARVEVGRC